MKPRSVWFPFASAPAAWACHGLAGWYVASLACPDDPARPAALSLSTARLVVAAITAVAFAVTASGAVFSFGVWREMADMRGAEEADRMEYVAFLSLFVTTVLSIALVWGGLPAMLSPECGAGR